MGEPLTRESLTPAIKELLMRLLVSSRPDDRDSYHAIAILTRRCERVEKALREIAATRGNPDDALHHIRAIACAALEEKPHA